jgi:hypothetical protein
MHARQEAVTIARGVAAAAKVARYDPGQTKNG